MTLNQSNSLSHFFPCRSETSLLEESVFLVLWYFHHSQAHFNQRWESSPWKETHQHQRRTIVESHLQHQCCHSLGYQCLLMGLLWMSQGFWGIQTRTQLTSLVCYGTNTGTSWTKQIHLEEMNCTPYSNEDLQGGRKLPLHHTYMTKKIMWPNQIIQFKQ